MTPVVTSAATPVPIDIRRGPSKAYPPGPNFIPRLLTGQLFRGVPTTDMTNAAHELGDLLHSTAFGRHIYQISHPSLIEDYFSRMRLDTIVAS